MMDLCQGYLSRTKHSIGISVMSVRLYDQVIILHAYTRKYIEWGKIKIKPQV